MSHNPKLTNNYQVVSLHAITRVMDEKSFNDFLHKTIGKSHDNTLQVVKKITYGTVDSHFEITGDKVSDFHDYFPSYEIWKYTDSYAQMLYYYNTTGYSPLDLVGLRAKNAPNRTPMSFQFGQL